MTTEGDVPSSVAEAEDAPAPAAEPPARPPRKRAPRKTAAKATAPRPEAAADPGQAETDLTLAQLLESGRAGHPIPEAAPEPPPPPRFEETRLEPAPDVLPARRGNRVVSFVLFLVVLLLAGTAGFGAAAYNESRANDYQSRVALLVDQPILVAVSIDQRVLLKLSALRFRYASQVQSTSFADEVATKAGLPRGLVRGALGVNTPPGLQLILTAKTQDPEQSRAIVSAAADVIIARNNTEQAKTGVKPSLRVLLTVISPAERGSKLGPDHKRSAEIGAAAAVAVLVVAALLRSVLRRRADQ